MQRPWGPGEHSMLQEMKSPKWLGCSEEGERWWELGMGSQAESKVNEHGKYD